MLSTRITAAVFRSDWRHPVPRRHMAVDADTKNDESSLWKEVWGGGKLIQCLTNSHVMFFSF